MSNLNPNTPHILVDEIRGYLTEMDVMIDTQDFMGATHLLHYEILPMVDALEDWNANSLRSA